MSDSPFADPSISPYLATALEALRLGVVITGEKIGTFSNLEAQRLLGVPDQRTPVEQWSRYVDVVESNGKPPTSIDPLSDAKEGQVVRRRRVELVHLSGKRIPAFLCVFPLELRPVAHVLLVEDLSWEQPEQREREKWLAAVGHEMRGALQTVLIATSFVAATNDAAGAKRHLDSIRRNMNLLGRLVEDLTQSALIADGVLHVCSVPVLLRPFLEQATSSLELHKYGHELTLDVQISSCALADPDRLQQIITNLLANAVKYSTPGKLSLHAEARSREVVISLTDEGPGISADDQRRLFTRYSRLPSKREGLGIGLWMCRELARKMGGDMWLRSKPGMGTTFFVALPRHGVTQEMPAISPTVQSAG